VEAIRDFGPRSNLLFIHRALLREARPTSAAAIDTKYEALHRGAVVRDKVGRLKAKASMRELRLLECQGGTTPERANEAQPLTENAALDAESPSSDTSRESCSGWRWRLRARDGLGVKFTPSASRPRSGDERPGLR
jgi:hypothetical protein